MKQVAYRLVGAVNRRYTARQVEGFLRKADDAPSIQLDLLRRFCRANGDSDFGREHGLAGVDSWASYRAATPILTYEQIRPYVGRMLGGSFRALLGSGERPLMFARSSGTTGAPKHIPVTRRFVDHYRRGWDIFGIHMLRDHQTNPLDYFVHLAGSERQEVTPSGLPAGLISGLSAEMQRWIIRRFYPAPPETRHIDDGAAKAYVTMRMAMDKNPAFIVSANPISTMSLARIVDQRAEQVIRDVRDGTLDASLPLAPGIRSACERRLRPNEEAARRLELLAERHGRLLPKHYWPIACVCNWTGGTVGLPMRDFPEYFGDAPVRDIGLLASEGRVTIPLESGTPDGVLDFVDNVFEFIAEAEHGADSASVLLPHELGVGERYYVVLTNSAGLFRYDIGDLVECTGFLGQAPILRFLSRGHHTANMSVEKVTEHHAVEAVSSALDALRLWPDRFIVAPVEGSPPHYRVSFALGAGAERHRGAPAEPVAELAAEVDRALQARNVLYAAERRAARLAPVQVRLVPADALARLDSRAMARSGAGIEQFKPRVLYTNPGEDDAALELVARAVSA